MSNLQQDKVNVTDPYFIEVSDSSYKSVISEVLFRSKTMDDITKLNILIIMFKATTKIYRLKAVARITDYLKNHNIDTSLPEYMIFWNKDDMLTALRKAICLMTSSYTFTANVKETDLHIDEIITRTYVEKDLEDDVCRELFRVLTR